MRALLSVANRDAIDGLARDLLGLGVEVFATDGTREALAEAGVEVRSISELTELPDALRARPSMTVPVVPVVQTGREQGVEGRQDVGLVRTVEPLRTAQ